MMIAMGVNATNISIRWFYFVYCVILCILGIWVVSGRKYRCKCNQDKFKTRFKSNQFRRSQVRLNQICPLYTCIFVKWAECALLGKMDSKPGIQLCYKVEYIWITINCVMSEMVSVVLVPVCKFLQVSLWCHMIMIKE